MTMTFETVRRICLALPGVEEKEAWGSPDGLHLLALPSFEVVINPGQLAIPFTLNACEQ